MSPETLKRILAALAILSLAPPARAQLATIETRDLRLIYNEGTLGYMAPYASRCFENALRFHEQLFHYEPKERVNVILDDFQDYGNASVWVNPQPSLLVHIAPVSYVYETNPSNERINFTMNHEVVHVVALDQAAGMDRFFRGLFHGRVRETNEHPESMIYSYLCVPRRAAPRWYHEGIAVFLETWMAGGLGRAQGPYDEMVFRSMVRDKSPFYDPLGLESEGVNVDFQAGANSYLYGTRFLSYLAYAYSPESLIRWVSRSPGSKPYFASQFRKVYGLPLGRAWRDWISWERGFQARNLDSIRQHPVTPSRDLSPRALGSVSRAYYDPASRTLYAGVDYPGAVAFLAGIPIDGGPIRKIREVKGPALYFVCSLAFDPASRTLFYTTDNDEWRDLCALDPATGRSRVLIHDARIGDLVFDPSDRSLWGIRHFDGISTLVQLHEPYNAWKQVYSWPFGYDLYDIDVSPDGRLLSGSLAEITGRQSLRVWRRERLLRGDSTSTTLYDFGNSIPAGFVFTPDGRSLYGSSYLTGVSNVFRYSFDEDSMTVVTNAETGFFRPVPIGRDSLVVFRYTGKGFVPALIDPTPVSDVSAITFLGHEIVERHPIVKEWVAPSPARVNLDSLEQYAGPYRGTRQMSLVSVYPIVEGYKSTAGPGVKLALADPCALDALDISATYTPGSDLTRDERAHLSASYRHLDWTFLARYNPASFYDLVGPTKVGRKGYSAGVTLKRPLLQDPPRTFELTVSGMGYGGLEVLPDAQNVATAAGTDKLVTSSATLAYRNLRSSIGSADAERGTKWQAIVTSNLVRYRGASEGAWRHSPLGVASLDVGVPLPISHSSLWLRTAAGYSPGLRSDPFANFYFGGFGNNWVDYQDPKRYRDFASFPGVDLDALAGTDFTRAMLDWNLPPIRFREAGNPAFFASWLRTSVFATGLLTNLDSAADRVTAADLGIQADLRLTVLVHQPLMVSVGYARAFVRAGDRSDETMISLKIL